jgi:hypothetical protein
MKMLFINLILPLKLFCCDICIEELQRSLEETRYWIRIYENGIESASDVQTLMYLKGLEAGEQESLNIIMKNHLWGLPSGEHL